MRDNTQSIPLGTKRRDFMKLMGVAGLGFAVSQIPTLKAFAQQDETIQDIINIAATAEALAVTLHGAVLANAAAYDNGQGLPATVIRWSKAIQAQEQAHYTFLTAAGAKALTLTFTIPQALVGITRNSKDLLEFISAAEDIFIAAYIAAGQRFAQYGQPDLARVAYQIMGVECEHAVLVKFARGLNPPNNIAYQRALYRSVSEAAAAAQNLGVLGGISNPAATLRYADFSRNIDASGVSRLEP